MSTTRTRERFSGALFRNDGARIPVEFDATVVTLLGDGGTSEPTDFEFVGKYPDGDYVLEYSGNRVRVKIEGGTLMSRP